MHSHDYAKEISLKTTDKQVPAIYAILIFVAFAGLVFLGYHKLKPQLVVAHSEQTK